MSNVILLTLDRKLLAESCCKLQYHFLSILICNSTAAVPRRLIETGFKLDDNRFNLLWKDSRHIVHQIFPKHKINNKVGAQKKQMYIDNFS